MDQQQERGGSGGIKGTANKTQTDVSSILEMRRQQKGKRPLADAQVPPENSARLEECPRDYLWQPRREPHCERRVGACANQALGDDDDDDDSYLLGDAGKHPWDFDGDSKLPSRMFCTARLWGWHLWGCVGNPPQNLQKTSKRPPKHLVKTSKRTLQ